MSIKEQAIQMRRKGKSYNEICTSLNVAKSTLSYWLKDLPTSKQFTQSNIEKSRTIWSQNITNFNKMRSLEARAMWDETQKKATYDIKKLTDYEIKLIGTALYWGEGYKKGNWSVVFVNSDPQMIAFMMIFFRKICGVPESKLRIQIQLYDPLIIKQTHEYWAGITNVPLEQFMNPNIQISKASKFKRGNTLPYGTCRIRINDVVTLNTIKGWIIGIYNSET